jgi:hypothetical protein
MAPHQTKTMSQSEYHLRNISMDIEAALMDWTQDGSTYLDTKSLTVPLLLACHPVDCTLPKGCSGPAASRNFSKSYLLLYKIDN